MCEVVASVVIHRVVGPFSVSLQRIEHGISNRQRAACYNVSTRSRERIPYLPGDGRHASLCDVAAVVVNSLQHPKCRRNHDLATNGKLTH